MEGFIHQVRREVVERLRIRDTTLVVGVSGGLDSMVLLHALARFGPRAGLRIEAAHCHHGIRGRAADLDERQVATAARQLGVGFHAGRVEVLREAEQSGESLEMVARRLRHRFLARVAEACGASWIVLGHHADDQAELVLMRLFRGAGSEGLAGMQTVSPSPVDSRFTLLRPLLGFTREDLAGAAAAGKVHFREDRTNRDPAILRNRIRHRILPFLCRELTPALPRILNRIAEIASSEAEFLAQEASRWRREHPGEDPEGLPVALQRVVLRQQLLEIGQVPDFDLVEALRRSAPKVRKESPARLPDTPIPKPDGVPPVRVQLRGRGSVPWRAGRIRWRIDRRTPSPIPGAECLDADRVGAQARIRTRRSGDLFRPLGMPRESRLKNLFIGHRVPRLERDSRALLCAGDGRIAWVEGLPPGEDFRVTRETRRWLTLWWEAGD